MTRPVNPNITIPAAFAVDGQKTDFTNEKLQNGFDPVDPDVLAGDNLNKFIDDTYKGLNYSIDGVTDLYDVTDNLKDLSNLSATGQAVLDSKANTNLSNLTTTGDAHFANPSLSNLNTTGENRLHALKGYFDNGELLTDSEGLADITNYAHSTFDSTKFTITGANVTTDGIATDFSGSNRAYTTFDYGGSDLAVSVGFYFTSNINSNGANIFQLRASNNTSSVFRCYMNGSYALVLFSASGENLTFYSSDGFVLNENDFIIVNAILNKNNTVTFKVVNVTQNKTFTKTSTGTIVNTPSSTGNILYIGNANGNEYYLGAIDLKYTSVYNNSISIFSGNKTGIDTIKPDDFTVVGTPTITDDGITNGLDSSNYISCDCINTDGEIIIPVPNVANDFGGEFVTGCYKLYKNSSWGERFDVMINTSNTSIVAMSNLQNIGFNFTTSKMLIKVVKSGYDYTVYYKLDNADWVLKGTYTKEVIPTGTTIKFQGGYNLDLNLYKNVVNGTVTNQPCLKIPYTKSITGSKVVDSYYRPRVQDMSEQFGYAPYYTLSDTDFTLPQGEIYGLMLNQSTPHIVESYENGKSGYIVYSNGLCKQWGYLATTSSSKLEYTTTLFKTFKDTNYSFYRSPYWTADAATYGSAFSAFYDNGYTAKTTTTVSFWMHESTYQDGTDWVAIGYIN